MIPGLAQLSALRCKTNKYRETRSRRLGRRYERDVRARRCIVFRAFKTAMIPEARPLSHWHARNVYGASLLAGLRRTRDITRGSQGLLTCRCRRHVQEVAEHLLLRAWRRKHEISKCRRTQPYYQHLAAEQGHRTKLFQVPFLTKLCRRPGMLQSPKSSFCGN